MRRVSVWLALIGATAACAEIAGLDDLPDVDAQVPADARGGDGGGGDVAQPVDAALEACGEGGVCAVVPSGYAIVAYDPTDQVPCAAGFGNATDLLENPQSKTSSCGCSSCQTTPTQAPSCSCGPDPVAFDLSWSTGTTCTPATTVEQFASSTCFTQSQSIGSMSNSFSIKPDAGCTPSGGACKQPIPGSNFTTTHTTGRRCDLVDASVGPCAGGSACLPTLPGASLCVTDGTMNACPSPFTASHVVGTMVVDTRSCNCGPCVLDAGSCATTVTFYAGGNCNFGAVPVPANGTCIKTTARSSGSASYTTTDVGASCGGGAPWVDGGVSLGGAYRICCL